MNDRRYKMIHFFLVMAVLVLAVAAVVFGFLLLKVVIWLAIAYFITGVIMVILVINWALFVLSRVDFETEDTETDRRQVQ